MKVALITDTHEGVRNDNQLFLNENKKFFEQVFFPYIDKNNIKTVVHLGDLVDRRKYVNYVTAYRLKTDFLEPLHQRDITTHFIAGNHDTYYKNSNQINALRELLKDNYKNFTIYDHMPTEVQLGDLQVLLIPWINEDKEFYSSAMERINQSKSHIAMGHLEISGFEMHKGSLVSHGIERDLFSKFDTVYSGHFHHKSTDGHIFYLGSHNQYTWSDYGDTKGFHVLDTETRDLTFIENPNRIFHKIEYNDSDPEFLKQKIDYSIYNNSYVKVIIKQKNNLFWFDKFIENLESANPYDLQVIEDVLNLNLEDEDIVDECESTLDICYSYIDKNVLTADASKVKVKNVITQLYNEALSIK